MHASVFPSVRWGVGATASGSTPMHAHGVWCVWVLRCCFSVPLRGTFGGGVCVCRGRGCFHAPPPVAGPIFLEGGRGWATLGWPALCPSPLSARCLGRVSARRQFTSCPCSICPCRSPTHVPRRMGCGLVLPRGTGGEEPSTHRRGPLEGGRDTPGFPQCAAGEGSGSPTICLASCLSCAIHAEPLGGKS